MHPFVKNILAVIVGLIIGSVVNMGIIMLSSSIIPPPEGADLKTVEGLKASMHLMQPKHFIMPFLAHALGTLAGAVTAALIAANRKMRFALIIGFLFLIGGLTNVFMLPSPMWFNALDLLGAYLPFAWLGGKMAPKKQAIA